VLTVHPTADGVYLGGYFTAVNGQSRLFGAAVDKATGALLPWSFGFNGPVTTITGIPGRLYVGGYFATISGVSRRGLAAFDAVTGALQDWEASVPGLTVMLAGDDQLYLGGSFFAAAYQANPYLAAVFHGTVDVADREVHALRWLRPVQPNPLRERGVVRLSLPIGARVRLELFDLEGRRVGTLLDGVDRAVGEHHVPLDGRGLANGVYFVRLSAGTLRESRRVVVAR
jgi:hypothetical protein